MATHSIGVEPTTTLARMRRAAALHAQGSSDGWLDELRLAAASAKTTTELAELGRMMKAFGATDLAVQVYRDMVRRDPSSVIGYTNLARLGGIEPTEIEAVARLFEEGHTAEVRAQLGFALGKLFAGQHQYDRAFDYYSRANEAVRKRIAFDPAMYQRRLEVLRATFNKPLFDRLRSGGAAKWQPIFIVGMPRSGSTLVEQVLASHSQVAALGETPLLMQVIGSARHQTGRGSLAEIVRDAKPKFIAEIGKAYRRGVLPMLRGKSRPTDKFLDNFWYVGLIKLMFPEARVIHCQRDPLDNCWSIFSQHFAEGGVPFGYDLKEIGTYYRQHQAIMHHWDDALPGYVLPLRYADMVDDFEPTVRRLLQFCALPWDDNCLAFHEARRPISTASYAQVRKPINRNGMGTSDPYRAHLAPLIEALGD